MVKDSKSASEVVSKSIVVSDNEQSRLRSCLPAAILAFDLFIVVLRAAVVDCTGFTCSEPEEVGGGTLDLHKLASCCWND